MILELPDNIDRYYLIQIMDGYSNVFMSPGTRTDGSGKKYCITLNDEKNLCPENMNTYVSNTSLTWLLGRTEVMNASDVSYVDSLQAEYKLYPLN